MKSSCSIHPNNPPSFVVFFFFFLLFLCSSFRIFFFFLVDGTHRNFRIYFGTMYKNQMKILTREREREREKAQQIILFWPEHKKRKKFIKFMPFVFVVLSQFLSFSFPEGIFLLNFFVFETKRKISPVDCSSVLFMLSRRKQNTKKKKKFISSWSICSPWWFPPPPLPISLSLHLLVFLIRPPPIIVSVMSPHLVRFNYLHRLFPRFFFSSVVVVV